LIIYLLIDSEQTPFAEQCGKRDPFWVAPAVWRHELINALSQHVRLRGLAMDDAMAALATADGLIETVTLRGLDEQIMRWSADHGWPAMTQSSRSLQNCWMFASSRRIRH
jgi:hypothetical protein